MKRVVVGLSGGVDSSVAALLLKKLGYEVIGLFMKNWDDPSVTLTGKCVWLEDSVDAMLVAKQLDIPFKIIDLRNHYNKYVVNYIYKEYQSGNTPNPDILCNRKIKFNIFLKKAIELKANYIATGHYVRKIYSINNGKKIYHLLSGKDEEKDQSYFLCQLNQFQLSKSLFPLGNLTKKQVREYAKKSNLLTAKKKDSQGLCFIGKVRLPVFLKKKIKNKLGYIIEIYKNFSKHSIDIQENNKLKPLSKDILYKKKDGKIIGIHNGSYFFTKGQRKGLQIGGNKDRMFVINTDISQNIVFVGSGNNHQGLYKKVLLVKNIHWIRKDLSLYNSLEVLCRIRYRQPLEKARIYKKIEEIYIVFKKPQFAVSKGQFAVLYIGNEVIGSGVIN
jgi:tRNA-uridine 2-sulfurtransferase